MICPNYGKNTSRGVYNKKFPKISNELEDIVLTPISLLIINFIMKTFDIP